MDVHLIDGTYELFRHFYAVPSARDANGLEVGAVTWRGRLGAGPDQPRRDPHRRRDRSRHRVLSQSHVAGLQDGRRHRSRRFSAQFGLLEESLTALGVTVWPMVEEEADDALAAAARIAARGSASRPGAASARRTRISRSACAAFGSCSGIAAATRSWTRTAWSRSSACGPASIPDYLALVGDAADGYPGLPGWGAKSAAAVLAKFEHIEAIPDDPAEWRVNAANAGGLARTLSRDRELALRFRELATLRADLPLFESIDALRWNGPSPDFAPFAERFDSAVTSEDKRPR